jgi:hypothetical protein
MEKFIIVVCLIVAVLTIALGLKSLRDLNDGRVQTVVNQLVK